MRNEENSFKFFKNKEILFERITLCLTFVSLFSYYFSSNRQIFMNKRYYLFKNIYFLIESYFSSLLLTYSIAKLFRMQKICLRRFFLKNS